jgi:hypothetical protein
VAAGANSNSNNNSSLPASLPDKNNRSPEYINCEYCLKRVRISLIHFKVIKDHIRAICTHCYIDIDKTDNGIDVSTKSRRAGII